MEAKIHGPANGPGKMTIKSGRTFMEAEAVRMTGVRWVRIVPAVFLMYTIIYFGRVNIGLALPSMSHDPGFSSTEAGLAGGIFFWGYLVTFLAAGWLAPRFGPRCVVLWSLIAWGLGAIFTGLVRDANELLVARLLLGAAEGPVWTSTAMLLSQCSSSLSVPGRSSCGISASRLGHCLPAQSRG